MHVVHKPLGVQVRLGLRDKLAMICCAHRVCLPFMARASCNVATLADMRGALLLHDAHAPCEAMYSGLRLTSRETGQDQTAVIRHLVSTSDRNRYLRVGMQRMKRRKQNQLLLRQQQTL